MVGRPVFKTGEGRLTLLWVRLLPLPPTAIPLAREQLVITMIRVIDRNTLHELLLSNEY